MDDYCKEFEEPQYNGNNHTYKARNDNNQVYYCHENINENNACIIKNNGDEQRLFNEQVRQNTDNCL